MNTETAVNEAQATPEEQEREAFLRSLDDFPVSEDLDDPVNTDVAIDRYLAALSEREAEILRNAQVATRRIDMIQAWLRDANARAEREAQWLRGMIEAFAKDYDFGKKKSRGLPSGTIGYRGRPATLEVTDPAAAVAFALANGLETKTTVAKTPLLAHFKATGEIPDGCEYVEGAETFFIRTGAGA